MSSSLPGGFVGPGMRKVWRALTSGIVSTLAMSLAFLMVNVQTRAQLRLFEAMARFFRVPGRVGLGFLVFVFFGVVVWPLLFAAIEPYLPPEGDPAVSGMLFATVLWVGFVIIGTTEIAAIVLPFYLAVTLVTHLVYGFTLGLVYGWKALALEGESPAMGQGIDERD